MRSPNTLIVFTKAPRITRVKTRMQGVFSHRECLYLHRQLYKNTLDQVRRSRGYRVVVYSLGHGVHNSKQQIGNNLAERMHHAIQTELKTAQRVCLIGCDSFDLNVDYITEAFTLLNKTAIVLGPSNDGGYLLVGSKHKIPHDVFKCITWGSSRVLEQTLCNIDQLNTTVSCLSTVIDIDQAQDWEALNPSSLPHWARSLHQRIVVSNSS